MTLGQVHSEKPGASKGIENGDIQLWIKLVRLGFSNDAVRASPHPTALHIKVKGKQDISTVIGSEDYVTDCEFIE
ncbi:hypothetical protein [Methylobacter luteus]|uniref:hypothetical protein n=1 Tax=Methylobacter luteus TaxID=415 RepID=UPI00040262A7|nr:hypothetical protein [Methylobacter luteus]